MDWQTPPSELEYVRRVGDLVLDPATSASNPTRAPAYFSPEHHNPLCRDGLSAPWARLLVGFEKLVPFHNPLAFLNPPYGRELPPWTAKVLQEAALGAQVVTLTPSRTDTRWWQSLAGGAQAGIFLSGRITFIDAATGKPCADKRGRPSPAPFPVFIGYFGQHKDRFYAAYKGRGRFL